MPRFPRSPLHIDLCLVCSVHGESLRHKETVIGRYTHMTMAFVFA